MVKNITVLGGGTAGLLAALTLRLQLPHLSVQIIYSSHIGVIGVGEGTTPLFPRHVLQALRLDPARLYEKARPIWKLGVRFLWGPRPEFFYSFGYQFDARWSDLPKANGYYAFEELPPCDIASALMKAGQDGVAPRRWLAAVPRRLRLPRRERPPGGIPHRTVPSGRDYFHRRNS